MATGREHFALDWIKDDLLESLNHARSALDDYAESQDETRLRSCLTNLHQVHGTLIMLELRGVTMLADHLEQLAQAMYEERLTDSQAGGQALMQGILELPGYLDELQRGGADSTAPVQALVNEIRAQLRMPPLAKGVAPLTSQSVNEESIAQFASIDGADKAKRIRAAYQNVLLLILKGEDRSSAVDVLGKIALGLTRICKGTPMEQQWVAFGEFVASLRGQTGALDGEAVKLLRHVDVEIKNLATAGAEVLRQPVNVELIRRLVNTAGKGEYTSAALEELRDALRQDREHADTLEISGRQAMSAAAAVLREDLVSVTDRLDLLARADSIDLKQLQQLTAPLKQMGSTLSLLGFDGARDVVAAQIASIEQAVSSGAAQRSQVEDIAGALLQVDETLAGAVRGSGQTEIEQITSDAQRQVLGEARRGLDKVKQAVVDFVTSQWSTPHLQDVPALLAEICGALSMIPLSQAIAVLEQVQEYVSGRLLQGYQPEWEELDVFADVVSAVDYYLERLAEDANSGAEEIIAVARRSLDQLHQMAPAVASELPRPEAEPQTEETAQEFQIEFEEEDVEQPAAFAAPAVGVPIPPSASSGTDPEIVEIFVEEVGEVLETLQEFVPQWAQSLEIGDALSEVRRAFHTLKGSGRIVGADQIGELAWSVENMLNRVIDGTVPANPQFVEVIEQACELVPQLLEAFARGELGDLDLLGTVSERADLLASGAELGDDAVSAERPAAADEEPLEQAAEPDRFEADSGLPGLDDLAQMLDEQDEPAVASPITEDQQQKSDADLFLAEAEECLALISAENQAEPWCISEPLARAFHTLVGSAAMAQMEEIKLVVEPADQVAEQFRNRPASDELRAFFREAELHLRDFLECRRTATAWEEPLAFVAQADDLLARGGEPSRPIDKLLNAAATEALFEAEADIAGLHAGDANAAVRIQSMLGNLIEFSAQAPELRMAPMAAIAEAMRTTLSDVPLPVLAADARLAGSLRSAYDRMIDQLNQLAGGGSIDEQPALIAELSAARVAALASTSDQPEAPAVQEREELADIDPELVAVFFEEAEEISEQLEAAILSWDNERDNRLYMENLLRSLHTLKGGARLCGLARLGDQAHEFESMVIEAQSNERSVDDRLFAHLNARYDAIVENISQVRARVGAGNATAPSVSQTDEALAPSQQAAAIPEPAQPAVRPAPLSVVGGSDQAPKAPQAKVDPARAEQTPTGVERQSAEMVRVSSSLLEALVNLAGESSILRARIEQGMGDFASSLEEMETTIERLREQLRRLEIETETQILYRHERTEGPQYENFDPLEMDRYNHLQQLSRGLSESASDMLDLKETLLFKSRETETLLLQQARINTELQEGLMRTRMVPFSRLLPRLRRIVRQVASELNKKVELHVQNPDGELDRNLLERILAPLEHMLRNAVDHGIESVEERRVLSKPEVGRIDLVLTREGGDVVIEISDDGAGIDVASVKAKAIERGLLKSDADLTSEEILQFVLAPGFSTAASVTQISGRGVGMDVVRSEVKQLGGGITISSERGTGSRFVIRVPFTVAINRALMVSIGDDQYAIPLNTIEGIVLVNEKQIQATYADADGTFNYAGESYQVRYLGSYLGREYHAGASLDSVPVVLVRVGDQAVAIHVDSVQGSREIVVKSLGPQFAGVGGISGATILGDGSVVIILDLLALIRTKQRRAGAQTHTVPAESNGPRCVMVVDDSVTVRKVTSRLLERQGMDVMVAKDGVEAVALLQEQRPDIMLLDIEMPRMDGFEVARQVRHDERLRDLPIIMISSRTGSKHKDHASELGVNKFLGKPFQESELLASIDELVPRPE